MDPPQEEEEDTVQPVPVVQTRKTRVPSRAPATRGKKGGQCGGRPNRPQHTKGAGKKAKDGSNGSNDGGTGGGGEEDTAATGV